MGWGGATARCFAAAATALLWLLSPARLTNVDTAFSASGIVDGLSARADRALCYFFSGPRLSHPWSRVRPLAHLQSRHSQLRRSAFVCLDRWVADHVFFSLGFPLQSSGGRPGKGYYQFDSPFTPFCFLFTPTSAQRTTGCACCSCSLFREVATARRAGSLDKFTVRNHAGVGRGRRGVLCGC